MAVLTAEARVVLNNLEDWWHNICRMLTGLAMPTFEVAAYMFVLRVQFLLGMQQAHNFHAL